MRIKRSRSTVGSRYTSSASISTSDHAIDVLACAGCGGHLRLIATIEDPPIVTKILAHLGLPTALPTLLPARSPPQPDGFDFT